MPVVQDSQTSTPKSVEEQKQGLFSSPVYGNAGLGNNPTADEIPKSSVSGPGDAESARRQAAGLEYGGSQSSGAGKPSADTIKFNSGTDSVNNDWRIRVSIHPSSKILYYAESDPGIVGKLRDTDGVIFPYVPTVSVSHAANYGSVPLTHSNYQNFFYESSGVSSISINADFTVQNTAEAEYFLAAIYFFRACTKMFYGIGEQYQGSPPPIVYLDGYGSHYLPHVSCVVTSFSHTMPADVDYMEVAISRPGTYSGPVSSASTAGSGAGTAADYSAWMKSQGGQSAARQATAQTYVTRVPTASQFSLTLQPVYSRNAQRNFDYGAFAKGDLISKAGSGGYI